MSFAVLTFLKANAPKAWPYVKALATNWYAKFSARNKALAGDDLAGTGALEHLVKKQLKEFASSFQLPPEYQGASFRQWLLKETLVTTFTEALVMKAGGRPEGARQAHEMLVREYEQTLGENSQVASARISVVIADLYGQLTATESARAQFDAALTRRIAALSEEQNKAGLRPFPTTADIGRFRLVGAALLNAGRMTWKMPAFVAPLTLEAYEEKDADKPGEWQVHQVDRAELSKAVAAGGNVILYGDGGIGKTTFLLELATAGKKEGGERTMIFVDAALWARSGLGILDYIATTPAARGPGVTADELTRLAQSGRLVLAVNGWNEIPADRKVECRELFIQLVAAAPRLSAVVTSRTMLDVPNLLDARRIAVRGLTWKGQSEVIRADLPNGSATLIDVLARNTRLRHAARSPLILRGLIERARTGADPAVDSTYDLLGAVVATLEKDEKRCLTLAREPVFDRQSRYLQQLACAMNDRRSVDLSREESLVAIGTVATELVEERLLGAPPQPAEVLEVLASHHVLHLQDDSVRFAHQRFQEYFSAAFLLRLENTADALPPMFKGALNEPAWADALELMAGKLKRSVSARAARTRLVAAAEALDLSLACDLAGMCAFSQADNAVLHDKLVDGVNALHRSPDTQVRNLATACQLASGLPAFAENLWALFESNDQQTRLNAHRLNGSKVSLAQLDPDAEARISRWPAQRRAEFLLELASNPDNYDFVVRTAMGDTDDETRTAVINALFWHYPASDMGVTAWLNAPAELQASHSMLSHLADAVGHETAGIAVRARLRELVDSGEGNLLLPLALRDAELAGPEGVDAALNELKIKDGNQDAEALLTIARKEPERLRALALELAGGDHQMPDWAGLLLQREPADSRSAAFESVWQGLFAEPHRRPAASVTGPLASIEQTRRSVETWLAYRLDRGSDTSQIERDRHYEIGYLLAHAPGDDLLTVVIELGVDAAYEAASELVDLIRTRVSQTEGRETRDNAWAPTSEQFQSLYDLMSPKPEATHVRQDTIFAYLACIASWVFPSERRQLLIDAFARQLDVLTEHREIDKKWKENPVRPRPMHPSNGGFVISAMVRWGMDAVPGLLRLAQHDSASVLVPEGRFQA